MAKTSTMVLVADDSEDDIFLLQRGFEKAGILVPMACVRDGEEALSWLEAVHANEDCGGSPWPTVILLDLKMPKVDGYGVLRWLQSRPLLRAVPVVVLSSSDLETDQTRVKALGAREYYVKPTDFREYETLARKIHERWLKSVDGPAENAEYKPVAISVASPHKSLGQEVTGPNTPFQGSANVVMFG